MAVFSQTAPSAADAKRKGSPVTITTAEPSCQDQHDEGSRPAATNVDSLLPPKFGAYHWRLVLSCTVCYGLGGVAAGIPNFLLPRLHDAGWHLLPIERTLVSSLLFFGNLIGLLFWGAANDRFGRLLGIRCGLGLMATSAAATFLATSVGGLLGARVLTGFANGAVMNSSFVLMAELTPPQFRVFAKSIQESGFSLGLLWSAVVAYLVRDADWHLLILVFLPVCPGMVAAATLPESPRYLLARGDADGALRVLSSIGRKAGCPLPPDAKLSVPEGCADSGSAPRVRWTPLGMCRAAVRSCATFGQLWHRSLRRRTVLVCGAWLGSTLVYYGVLYAPSDDETGGEHALGNLTANGTNVSETVALEAAKREPVDYAGQALGAVVELPSYMLMVWFGDCLGRPRAWALLLALGAAPLFVLGCMPSDAPATLVLLVALLGRMGAAGASTICYVAAAEQFPTTCRSLGVGAGASLGRLGSIASPFILLLPGPQIILAAIASVAAICAAGLPETKGRAIPDSIEEEEKQVVGRRREWTGPERELGAV